jgi:hypothetical protein
LHESDLGSLESKGDYDIDSDEADAYLYEDDIDDEAHFANMSSDDDDANLYLVRIDPVFSLTEYRWLVDSRATSHMSGNPKLFI